MNKNIIALSLAASFLTSMTAFPAAAQAMGDIDGSGNVDSYDSLLVLRHSVGLEKLTDEQKKLADIDNDNSINSADALYILRMSVGLEPFSNAAPKLSEEKEKSIMETIDLYDFEGVIYAQKDCSPYYTFAQGTLENGKAVTSDSSMPIGSVSKQFCAAAILSLAEKGKLSTDDSLDKYFPDYAFGNKVKISHLLTMRSGIPELSEDADVTVDKTEEENMKVILSNVFSKRLSFEPGKQFAYTNTNYILLANIIEQVSGTNYSKFIRDNFFIPLGMDHTGTIAELDKNMEWSNGLTVKQVDLQPGLTKGCGDVISNAQDMMIWLNSLSKGQIISKESYKIMTTDMYGDNYYGCGMFLNIDGGIGHPGMIGIYSAYDYICEDKGLKLFVVSNSIYPPDMNSFFEDLLYDLL